MNVKFTSYNLQRSFDEDIIDEILSNKPNIIAIQGCCKENCDLLIRKMKENAFLYYRFVDIFSKYEYELLFTNLKILKACCKPFRKSFENRFFTKYLVGLGEKEFFIATSRLESEGPAIRKQQILELENEFDPKDLLRTESKPFIFGGDTCIPFWQKFDMPFKDSWYEKGNVNNERTDCEDRFQRFWYSHAMQCLNFDIFGEEKKGIIAEFKI